MLGGQSRISGGVLPFHGESGGVGGLVKAVSPDSAIDNVTGDNATGPRLSVTTVRLPRGFGRLLDDLMELWRR